MQKQQSFQTVSTVTVSANLVPVRISEKAAFPSLAAVLGNPDVYSGKASYSLPPYVQNAGPTGLLGRRLPAQQHGPFQDQTCPGQRIKPSSNCHFAIM